MARIGDLVLQKERDRESVKLERKFEQKEQRKVYSFDRERRSCPPKRETENQYEINKRKESILPNNG